MAKYRKAVDWQWPAMWICLLCAIVFGVISGLSLVNNSKEAKRRYEVLIAVDKSGGDVEGALNSLREYVYAHMNTTIGSPNGIKPPIQLKGTYDRLVAESQAKAAESNKKIYAEAQSYCEQRYPAGTLQSGRVPCVTEYITNKGVNVEPVSEALYQFDFVSPIWSPDVAGWTMLASILSFMAFFILLLSHRRTKRKLLDLS